MRNSGWDNSLTSTESKNFHALTDVNRKPIMTKSFNGNDIPVFIGPALEKKGKCSLTGEPFPYMSTIIWIPNKNGPGKGTVVPLETIKAAYKNQDSFKIKQLQSVGIPDISTINKMWII